MKILLMIVLAALPLVLPYLYSRYQALSLLFANAPDKLPQAHSFASYEVKFADIPRVRNCEDALILEEEGVALLGCDPGRDKWNSVMGIDYPGEVEHGGIWAYDYATGAETIKEVELISYPDAEIHLLGLAYHAAAKKLFTVNHARDGLRVDTFTLDLASPSGPKATYDGSIADPELLRAPNSIAAVESADGRELYVTNDHRFPVGQYGRAVSMVEEYAAIPAASVVHVDLETRNVTRVARVPYGNGVEFVNSTTLAVASTVAPGIFFYDVDPETKALAFKAKVPTPFLPDNLSVDKNGALLIAGHPHPPSLTEFANSRAECNAAVAAGDEAKVEECSGIRAGSWVAEWTEEGGLRDLYVGTDYPTSATAARDVGRKIGVVAGLFAKGFLVFKE